MSLDLLGVRFRPGAATDFLDLEAHEVTATQIAADTAWRDAGSLVERLQAAPQPLRRGILDEELQSRRRSRRETALARIATAAMERAAGEMTVRSLSLAMGVTERTLQRVFERAVGTGPKQVQRVRRFRAAAAMLSAGQPMPLSRMAYTCGYSDQAHLTRDFVELAGVTPTVFRSEKRLVGFIQD
jgi:transcriptional regulator GlxA family with amidase domain